MYEIQNGKVLQSAPSGACDAKGNPIMLAVVVGKSSPHGESDGQAKVYTLAQGAALKEGERFAEPADLLAVDPSAHIKGHAPSKKKADAAPAV